MEDIGEDILVNIIDRLDAKDRWNIRLVCKTLHAAAASSALELRPEKRLRSQQLLELCRSFSSTTALDLSHFYFLGGVDLPDNLHASLQALPRLKTLSLANSHRWLGMQIGSLFSNINLSSLQRLSLRSCAGLEELPEGLGALSLLQSLDVSHLPRIGTLPRTHGPERAHRCEV